MIISPEKLQKCDCCFSGLFNARLSWERNWWGLKIHSDREDGDSLHKATLSPAERFCINTGPFPPLSRINPEWWMCQRVRRPFSRVKITNSTRLSSTRLAKLPCMHKVNVVTVNNLGMIDKEDPFSEEKKAKTTKKIVLYVDYTFCKYRQQLPTKLCK